ncbi:MAG: deacetylase [Thiobacillus sp. 65-69]|jgi:acetoin utilization deacetylase AcuC-like enzyme|nr:histone deacetylase family protein [Thiobacillus sp.]ODU90304.1 MAG: deacetylase [Thiobacillus sp. SCN 65-179]OJW34810.1 MAG: deacetylase [Thiobacillus sp. 65-69]
MPRVAYLTHADCAKHDVGPWHPESPERVQAVDAALRAAPWFGELLAIEAPYATPEQLARAHTQAHVDAVRAAVPERGVAWLDPDTGLTPHSWHAACAAAGAVVRAVDTVMASAAQRAFCNVRPPGHHAEADRAMGFCLFNNAAIGIHHALAVHGLARVALVDFDVHHGNGSEDILRDETRVLLLSSFRHPFYPHSGAQPHAGYVPVPLPAGADGRLFREAFERDVLPGLDAFRPELICVSAGFDAHRNDSLGGLNLLEDDYAWITRTLCALADRHAQGRLVSVLEGGYDLGALGRSAVAHVEAMR